MYHKNHCDHPAKDYIGSIEYDNFKFDVHQYKEFDKYQGYCVRYDSKPSAYWSISEIACHDGEDLIDLFVELANQDSIEAICVLKLLYLPKPNPNHFIDRLMGMQQLRINQ